MTSTISKLERSNALSRVFTPSSPINKLDLFSGRIEEIFEVTGALNEPGRHVVLYGERGVGKTSLSNLLTELIVPAQDGPRVISKTVNCSTRDTFTTVWKKAFRELRVDLPEAWNTYGFVPDPDDIRFMLESITPPKILVLDEYDRMEDDESVSLMADTIKSLSDHAIETKLVIVGVADSISDLIGEHESVQRAIHEVLVPRMKTEEMQAIVAGGYQRAQMSVDEEAVHRIAVLSEGLPHYAHLLALGAGQRAIQDDRTRVSSEDLTATIEKAVEKHSLANEYQTAVQSPRREALFAQVLTACAVADKNRLGYFTPASVKAPLSKLLGKEYPISAFVKHLKLFTEAERGSVLQRSGGERKAIYRFRNPLLQPYVLLNALAENLVPSDFRESILA